jgi:uncharacterized membrane protein YjjP (DUF1212 family)
MRCVAGLVWHSYVATCYPQLTGAIDYLVAILTAVISVLSFTLYITIQTRYVLAPQVMGTLYGTAFSLSLYEITNNQVMTGLLRFAHAILRGVMAVPLDPCLEYGLHHGLDQTIRISPTWFALLCSP